VQYGTSPCRICGDKVLIGEVFLLVLRSSSDSPFNQCFILLLRLCTNLQRHSMVHLKYLSLVFGMSPFRISATAPIVLIEV
jgi:hypothetical protein